MSTQLGFHNQFINLINAKLFLALKHIPITPYAIATLGLSDLLLDKLESLYPHASFEKEKIEEIENLFSNIKTETFDLVVAELINTSKINLDNLFSEVKRTLNPNGIFIFIASNQLAHSHREGLFKPKINIHSEEIIANLSANHFPYFLFAKEHLFTIDKGETFFDYDIYFASNKQNITLVNDALTMFEMDAKDILEDKVKEASETNESKTEQEVENEDAENEIESESEKHDEGQEESVEDKEKNEEQETDIETPESENEIENVKEVNESESKEEKQDFNETEVEEHREKETLEIEQETEFNEKEKETEKESERTEENKEKNEMKEKDEDEAETEEIEEENEETDEETDEDEEKEEKEDEELSDDEKFEKENKQEEIETFKETINKHQELLDEHAKKMKENLSEGLEILHDIKHKQFNESELQDKVEQLSQTYDQHKMLAAKYSTLLNQKKTLLSNFISNHQAILTKAALANDKYQNLLAKHQTLLQHHDEKIKQYEKLAEDKLKLD